MLARRRRDPTRAGNGLFTFSLLQALTDRAADSSLLVRVVGKTTVDEARDYVERYFHDQARASVLFKQTPRFVPARSDRRTALRRLCDDR